MVMSHTPDSNQPVVYEVRIAGHLPAQWSDWFGSFAVTLEPDGTTLLSGPLVDQAALYGLLKKVRDTGLTLIAVNQTISKQEKS
jgi:hypothetical protein